MGGGDVVGCVLVASTPRRGAAQSGLPAVRALLLLLLLPYAVAQKRYSGSTSMAHANLESNDLLNTFSIGTSCILHLRVRRASAQSGTW